MDIHISVFLKDHPTEARIIGDMLLGWVDIETNAVLMVGQALGGTGTAIRVLYRIQSAQSRLDVIDAVLRPYLAKLKLSGPFCQWLGAMRHCKKIRNQYAHCGWISMGDGLRFCDLEEAASMPEGEVGLKFLPIDLDTLKDQQSFFQYTTELCLYLTYEARFRRDRRRRHSYTKPKDRAVPKLNSLPGSKSPRRVQSG